MQDPTGKVQRVSAWHFKFMYPAEYYVTALPQMEMFGRTAKFINQPSLMPDLYKDLNDDRHTAVDKQCQQSELGMLPQFIHNQHLTDTSCDPTIGTLCYN